jgi:HTH-type transcriptional regulator, transcriptional repressor of NAD biosynthesis genes
VRRVVVLGSESTGSTTLCGDLAAHLGVLWVPEHLRAYADQKAADVGSIWDVTWSSADFDAVADGQEAADTAALAEAERRGDAVLICDNDVLAIAVWHFRYLGTDAPHLVERAVPPDLYVLTTPDGVPFVQDGLRDGEHVRAPMTDWFRAALAAHPAPWIEAVGDRQGRVERVTDWLSGQPGRTQIRTGPTATNPLRSATSSPGPRS